jgi:phosphoribosylanthranilate isomerase
LKIKICGITNLEDAEASYSLGADALGFIFFPDSKRYIEPSRAAEIISRIPPFTAKVGVFVNEKAETVNKIALETGINLVQLHGDETPDYISALNYPVIKAFRVNEVFNFDLLNEYANCSFLLDAYDARYYGGTGTSFNWDKIPIELRGKIILAGGISKKNILQVYTEINPYAVDISSSIESSPGKKDINKLKSLFKIIGELNTKIC